MYFVCMRIYIYIGVYVCVYIYTYTHTHKHTHTGYVINFYCLLYIDYILTNKKLSPLVNDTKVFRGYDVTTDHYLLISKIRLPQKWYIFTKRSLRQE